MRVRSRRVHAASVMSVALVAVARAAREAHPSRRVTCVRVPQDAPDGSAAGLPELADGGPDDIAAVPLAPFWFEDPALRQPTEVMRTLVVAVEPEPTVEPAAPAVEPEPTPEPAAPAIEPGPAPTVEREPAAAAERESAPAPAAIRGPEPVRAPAAAATPAPEPIASPKPAQRRAPAPDPDPDAADAWGWAEPWAFDLPDAGSPRRPRSTTTRDASRRPRGSRRRRTGRGHPLAALAVIVLAVVVCVWAVLPRSPKAGAQSLETAAVSYHPRPSAFALRTIPAAYLRDYSRVAAEYDLDWTKLAAVGQIESDQGRSQTPGVAQGTNPAGAAGPAQFLGSTWARFGVDADGRGSSNPYDPADAITAMAAYLKASGAPQDWHTALYTYNHSTAYVDEVIALSRRYLGP